MLQAVYGPVPSALAGIVRGRLGQGAVLRNGLEGLKGLAVQFV